MLCQPLMLFVENRLWTTRLIACRKRPVPGTVGHEDVRLGARRASDMGWRKQADTRFTKILIGPYTCIRAPDGKAQIGYKLISRRAYQPLLIMVDPLE